MDVVRRVAGLNGVPAWRVLLAVAAYRIGRRRPLRGLGLSRPPTRADIEAAERDFRRVR